MPKLFLIPEIVSQKIHVYLNVDHHQLSAEIKNQLTSYKHVQFVNAAREADVCIYLVGFDPPSLSETLTHTSQLYEDLKQVKSDHHKFILVVKNPTSHLSRTAITLTSQFAHNYGLNHEVIEYDQSYSVSQISQAIIRKFIYDHNPIHSHSQQITSQVPPIYLQTVSPKPKKIYYWILLPFVGLIPWLVSGLILVSLLTLSRCLYILPICSTSSHQLHTVLLYTTKLSPGFSIFADQMGLPSTQFKDVLNTLVKLNLTTKIIDQKSAIYLNRIFSGHPAVQVENLLAGLSDVDHLLNQLQADLRALYLSTPRHISSFEKLALSAAETRHTLNILLPNLAEFLASLNSGKKTYLVALQDNWELRGSGGLVETFLIIDFENGQIDQFQPFSTKDTDKLLKGSVQPPADFQSLTKLTQWYMRDSSWDPNIKNTLEKIAWFAQNEVKRPIDGVILIDLNTLKSLVQIVGSVQVGESQSPISYQNFSSIYQSELDSSKDYSQFLKSLLSAVFSQLGNLDSARSQKVIKLLYNQVKNRQIFVSSLSMGEMEVPECRSFLPCHIDYSYPVSSNMSGSKTNFYLHKSQNTSITLTDTNQTTLHQFSYRYSPPTNSSAGPNHQEYLRVYVPSNISPDYQVTIDGKALPKDSIQTGLSGGLKYLGVSFTVNKNQQVNVDFSYRVPIPTLKQFHYQLDLPNQPGVIGDEVTLSLSYPPTWAAVVDKAASVAAAGHLEYNYTHPNNFQLNIDFTRP